MKRFVKDTILIINNKLQSIYYFLLNNNKRGNQPRILFLETNSTKLSFNFIEMKNFLEDKGLTSEFISAGFLNINSWFEMTKKEYNLLKEISKFDIIFLNENFELFNKINLYEHQKLIQLWHASGIYKKFGYSLKDKSYSKERNFEKFPIHKNYDLVAVSSEYVVPFYQEAMNEYKNVKALGTSRTDYYFNKDNYFQSKEKFNSLIETDKKIIIYAPTFRGKLNTEQNYPLDVELIKKKLQNEYVLIYKFHPFINGHNLPVDNSFSFDFSNEMDFHELALIADLCITDYSSVVFDWSLLKKPISFFLYDIDDYEMNRGFFEPLNNLLPGDILTSNDEIIDWVLNPKNLDKITEFKNKYMSSCNGNSTETIFNYIMTEL